LLIYHLCGLIHKAIYTEHQIGTVPDAAFLFLTFLKASNSNPLDINSPSFDNKKYLENLLRTKTLADLMLVRTLLFVTDIEVPQVQGKKNIITTKEENRKSIDVSLR
jgi:hypothetical protein